MTAQIIAAISVTLFSTVGQLEEQTHERTGEFIEQAVQATGLDELSTYCISGSREEKRYWLIGEQGAVYMLRLQAPAFEDDIGGEFFSFHDSRVERLHQRRIYDWEMVASLLTRWDPTESGMYAHGQRSFLSLVIESCHGSFYKTDTFWGLSRRPRHEQRAATTIKGVILSLDTAVRLP